MELILKMERAITGSQFYREFLAQMPAPFNNVYFDMLLAMLFAGYLMFRIIDFALMKKRHKRLRERQEEARQRDEADRMLREEEARLQRGKLAAFLQFMEQKMSPGDSPTQGWPEKRKGLGGRRLRLGSTHSKNDFEILMEEAKRNDE